MHRSLAALAGVTLLLLLPAAAQAGDFYVQAGQDGSACTQTEPCPTIQMGINQATGAGASGPATVHVGTGNYGVFGDTSPTTPITVEGNDGANVTVTEFSGPLVTLNAQTGSLTLRNLQLTVPATSAPSTSAVSATGGTLDLESVTIDVSHTGTGSGGSAIVTRGTTLTTKLTTALAHTDKPALDLVGPATIEESYVVSDTSASPTLTGSGPSAYKIVRSQIAKTAKVSNTNVGYAVQALTPNTTAPPTITLDSSLIRGGEVPLFVSQAMGQTANVTWTLQNATVDSQGSGSFKGILYSTNAANDHIVLNADSSILVDKFVTYPDWITSCTYSDVSADSQVSAGDSCRPGLGNNTSGATSVFLGPDSYVPKYESRVVDTGNPSPPAGFSQTDLQRAARKLPGHGGCVGFLDRGAVEYDGSVGTPPSVSIAGPAALVSGASGSFSAPSADTLTYAWSADDGATGSAATFDHAFTTVGNHTVTLLATRPEGTCKTTVTKDVTVSAAAVMSHGGGGAGAPAAPATYLAPTSPADPMDIPPPITPITRDTTKPTVSLASLTRTKVSVKVSEAAKITAKLCRKQGKKTVCVTKTLTATKASTVSATLKKLARARYTLTLTAIDTAKNKTVVTTVKRLR